MRVVDEVVHTKVRVEREGSLLLVTIDRPEAGNAVDQDVCVGIGEALEEAERDPAVRAVVLTGRGSRYFCAGADLKALARGEPVIPTDPRRAAWGFGGYVRHPISKPTVAAVNGIALGGGTELVLASDLAVTADSATFGLPEVRRGLFAGGGGAFRLPAQLPAKAAMELLLTGDTFSAARAADLGLVNRVVSQTEVLPAAMALAERVARNAPLAVQATKRLALGLVAGHLPAEEESWARSAVEADRIFASRDVAEGLQAFAEGREPTWEAR